MALTEVYGRMLEDMPESEDKAMCEKNHKETVSHHQERLDALEYLGD
jgi:hypothetical protein